jgi:hypothetical protein
MKGIPVEVGLQSLQCAAQRVQCGEEGFRQRLALLSRQALLYPFNQGEQLLDILLALTFGTVA